MTYHNVVLKRLKRLKPSKRLLPLIVFTALAPLFLSACGGLGGGGGGLGDTSGSTVVTFAPNSTMGLIKTRGSLIVGTRFDVPPFSFQDPNLGTPAGYDVQLVNSIASAIFGTSDIEGKINWVPLDPKNFELALEQNKVDIVVGRYAISPSRKQFVDFAGPYFASPQSVVARSNQSDINDQINTVSDLNGRKVCVVTGSTDIPALQGIAPGANTSDVKPTVAQCGQDLLTGVADAIAADHIDLLKFVNNSSLVTEVATGYGVEDYGIGVKKGTDDMRMFLNDQITNFDYDANYDSAIGTDGNKVPPPVVDRY